MIDPVHNAEEAASPRVMAASGITPPTAPKADPNGEAAGIKFLEENKGKPGVVTLPSGLQYKVLVEGGGVEHPTSNSPCACHYAGRLLDGTEFDSSYSRGSPSTFAPNQVSCRLLRRHAFRLQPRRLRRHMHPLQPPHARPNR